MIARIWKGITPTAKADQFYDYLMETGARDFASLAGNRGMLILRRTVNGQAEFLVISLWDSLDAIKQFAGPNVETARYYPDDSEYLVTLEPGVQHYEVLARA